MAADVTARKLAEARIEQLATRDALTGLGNRALLAERTAEAIAAAARTRSELALLAIDLDRFKLVNGTLGHAAGDALLRAVAERLSNAARREDMLARLRGDDFALLWPGPQVGGRGGEPRRAARRGPRPPVHRRGPHARGQCLDRHCLLPRRRARLHRALEARRRGDARRNTNRAPRFPLLRAGARRASGRAAAGFQRAARRAFEK